MPGARRSKPNVAILGDVILEAGAKVTKTAIAKRRQREGDKKLVAFDKETDEAQGCRITRSRTAPSMMRRPPSSTSCTRSSRRKSTSATKWKSSTANASSDLEELADPIRDDRVVLLTETRYRELSDMFGHVFKAGMGAEAVLQVLQRVDLDVLRAQLKQEILTASGQRRKKATKRLNVVESLKNSGNKPEWMVFQVLPVLPAGPAPDGPARWRPLRHQRPERPLPPRHQPQQPPEAAAGPRRPGDHHPQRKAHAAGSGR